MRPAGIIYAATWGKAPVSHVPTISPTCTSGYWGELTGQCLEPPQSNPYLMTGCFNVTSNFQNRVPPHTHHAL